MTLKPIISDDIRDIAQRIVANSGIFMTKRSMEQIVRTVSTAIMAERMRAASIIEQFDPELAQRLWSEK